VPAPKDVAMTISELKKYLSAVRTGGGAVPQINDLVDSAVETGFAQVWGAYEWKIRRAESTDLTCTTSQAYTVLPDDLESVDSIVVIDGTSSFWVDLKGEGNFEMDYPYPSGHATGKPYAGKVVFNSAAQGNRWLIYWCRIPNSAYSLRVIYQRVGSEALIPQLPSYMLAAVVDRCLEYTLPPGEGRLAQHQAANSSLKKAIQSDEMVSGPPKYVGVDPGWNVDAFVGNAGDDGSYLEGRPWL